MRRLLLTIALALMGLGLVGGAAAQILPTSLLPLDQEVGTHTSAAGAVLGIGLAAAAVNPVANISWVRAGILYGFVVLFFEAGAYFMIKGAQFHLGPVIFGLAFSLLLIAVYPDRGKLLPPTSDTALRKRARATAPAAAAATTNGAPAEKESPSEKKD